MIVDCPHCSRRHVILDRAAGTVARCECGREFQLPATDLLASTFKCANCGANPPAGANHCPYCDAHLTTLRCARCHAQSSEGDRHCRACGHALASAAHTLGPRPDKIFACPRCENPLRAIMSGDAIVDECTRCGGLWLDHDVFREILVSERDQEELITALHELRPAPKPAASERLQPEDDKRFYVPCPECERVMDRRQFARMSGIVIDVCNAHGIWFDHDELSRIIRFVGDGGMTKTARRLRLQRLADDAFVARKPGPDNSASRTGRDARRPDDLLAKFISELLD